MAVSFLGMDQISAQNTVKIPKSNKMNSIEVLKTQSHIDDLNIAINHLQPDVISKEYPVLFLHGSSFPTALSFGFKMDNTSWMSNLSKNGYDVFALDFLGYGNSDRYPEMEDNSKSARVVGRAEEVVFDVEKAVDFIKQKTGKNKVYLIGHSWGGSVTALYASKFPENIQKLVLLAAITVRNETDEAEKVSGSFDEMTPKQRIEAMKNLTPNGKTCQLEKEVFESWGEIWKKSDPLLQKLKLDSIRFPSGPNQDVLDLFHNKSYYNPSMIKAPTLIIRGDWDQYPNNADAENLFNTLENAASKKYVVLKNGTHVAHLEKCRTALYDEVLKFLF